MNQTPRSTTSAVSRLHATPDGLRLERNGSYWGTRHALTFDQVFTANDPLALVESAFADGPSVSPPSARLAPLQSQEVWAAGVTYLRSCSARMAEARSAGGGDFYDRVYEAKRPELFFKASPSRVAGPCAPVRIRSDSRWNVPEAELTLAINASGRIFGYTIGNDMSSRDIEGENPLYLPQAKVYRDCAALGPCLVLDEKLPAAATVIALEIRRHGEVVCQGETELKQMRRPLSSLAEWLFRDNVFPHGCYLMTGTGIVPQDDFTLSGGDEIRITIEPVGTLVNSVAAS